MTAVTNASTGSVVERYSFDPNGNVTVMNASGGVLGTSMSASTISQVIGFQGGYTEINTRLINFGVRWLNPATGTWTQEDPAGAAGSGNNLFQFEGGNTIDRADPSGLCDATAWSDITSPIILLVTSAGSGGNGRTKQSTNHATGGKTSGGNTHPTTAPSVKIGNLPPTASMDGVSGPVGGQTPAPTGAQTGASPATTTQPATQPGSTDGNQQPPANNQNQGVPNNQTQQPGWYYIINPDGSLTAHYVPWPNELGPGDTTYPLGQWPPGYYLQKQLPLPTQPTTKP